MRGNLQPPSTQTVHYLFVYALFRDTVIISDNVASDVWMITKSCTEKDVERIGRIRFELRPRDSPGWNKESQKESQNSVPLSIRTSRIEVRIITA
jgi:hypothetical protein